MSLKSKRPKILGINGCVKKIILAILVVVIIGLNGLKRRILIPLLSSVPMLFLACSAQPQQPQGDATELTSEDILGGYIFQSFECPECGIACMDGVCPACGEAPQSFEEYIGNLPAGSDQMFHS